MTLFHSPAATQKAFCSNCGHEHMLPREPAMAAARDLMARMDQELATDYLYGEARGKMFGILVCRTPEGEKKILKAFSGQYNGQWEMSGWVPPLFDVKEFRSLNDPVEKQIKALGREAAAITAQPCREPLLHKRKHLSQKLMKDIHALYTLHNFREEQCSLFDLFPDDRGIPTGTGDCCAPKLLNFAAIHRLHPLGLTEFYWGKTNRSASRQEGQFYLACEDKCGPLLGFLLCGSEK